MGSKLDRTIDRLEKIKTRIRDLYGAARVYKLTAEKLREHRNRTILDTEDFKRLPRWAQAEIHGYQEAMWDCFFASLDDRWEYNGKSLLRHELDSIPDVKWPEVKYQGRYYPGTACKYV